MAFDQTEDRRLDFMAVIDRTGSVRAAAASVGVHPDTSFRWMRQPGLSTPRSTQRAYSNEQQTKLLDRLALVGHVSAGVLKGRGLSGRARSALSAGRDTGEREESENCVDPG